jgi:hypothetical protein
VVVYSRKATKYIAPLTVGKNMDAMLPLYFYLFRIVIEQLPGVPKQ